MNAVQFFVKFSYFIYSLKQNRGIIEPGLT